MDFLYSERNTQGYWEDKWHISPLYATASCALALAKHPKQAIKTKLDLTIDWIIETQSGIDGGWGVHGQAETGTTMEETAYALQVLQAVSWFTNDEDQRVQRVINRGIAYLWQRFLPSQVTGEDQVSQLSPYRQYEPLWRDKTLYVPTRIVTSTILAVLSRSNAHTNL